MTNNLNKEILHLAIPSIVSNITIPLLGLVDLTIVGHIGNENYISAIAIGSMIFNLIYWGLGFLRMGTSGMTSQAYGRTDWNEALSILLRALFIGLGMGCLFIIGQYLIEWGMVRAMNTPQSVYPLVHKYFKITIWGAPAMLGLYGLTGWFIGMQNTKVPMVIAIAQNIVNIVASMFFVYVLGWNIEGVATGTLIAQWVGFALSVATLHFGLKCNYFFKAENNATLSLRFMKTILQTKDNWGKFFSVNRDIFLRTLCLIAVNMYFTSAGGRQGAMILAVNTLLMTLFTIFSYFMDGFAYAAEALSGKYYGAQNAIGFKLLKRQLLYWGLAMVVFFTAIYVVGGTNFLSLLTNNTDVVLQAQPYLMWSYLIPIAGVFAFIYDGIFIGISETKGMLVSALIAAICFFVFYHLAYPSIGNHALWIAFLLFLSIRGILQGVWTRKYIIHRL